MTRSQALLAAGVITAATAAFVVGAGARLGAFGFGSDGAPPDLPAVTVTDAAAPLPPDAIATATIGTRWKGEQRPPFERGGERRHRQEKDDDD